MTKERIERICEAILVGAGPETAALYAGVSRRTLYNWMHQAHGAIRRKQEGSTPEKKDPRALYFLRKMETALAEAEVTDLTTISAASVSNWTAAAWRLERRFPGRWGSGRVEREKQDGFIAIGAGASQKADDGPVIEVIVNPDELPDAYRKRRLLEAKVLEPRAKAAR